ncbi:alpha-2-macroglobulin-like protein 1 [Trichonephila inaurata madagascariensis]|uniref:Alpha-2-macroglobulin-like protein 1 n=1 Tax=Trichonephila inaurata madagascariensis TaxID=2747483 RepID=A0A8X6YFC4_9ARAC|nr:alpha-2-macroglobulin-like protein 1 [Trichonephila inaurata madagascariensis]
MCLNCLSDQHRVSKCKSKHSCSECGFRHNTLLHRQKGKSANTPLIYSASPLQGQELNPNAEEFHSSQENIAASLSCTSRNKTVILPTAVVWVLNHSTGSCIQARAVLDSGSMSNIVTQDFANLSLEQPQGFAVANDSFSGDICIQPNTNNNIKLQVKATDVGTANITVRAETASSSKVCGNSPVYGSLARDAIKPSFEVEAEGFPTQKIHSILFCPKDEKNGMFSQSYNLTLPKDVVPDSARAIVDVTGNVLGPAIQNLNSLVSLPTGCGKQNMVKFTPNYLVLDYLTDIDKLTDDIKSMAIRNLNTSFVLRSFYEAQRYITIDDSLLNDIQKWITEEQQADGCFSNVGRIIDILDTVVGFHALSNFASLVYKDPVNIQVSISGGLQETVQVTQDNKLLIQRNMVSQVPSTLRIQAQGQGCGILQTYLRYHTTTPPEERKFRLNVVGECISSDCKQRKITTVVSYIPQGKIAGMSVVQIKMITGTVPDKDSLDQLTTNPSNKILRADVEDNKVNLYLSEVSNYAIQFSFNVDQVIEVENTQLGPAKVFDYYAPEIFALTTYSFKNSA